MNKVANAKAIRARIEVLRDQEIIAALRREPGGLTRKELCDKYRLYHPRLARLLTKISHADERRL